MKNKLLVWTVSFSLVLLSACGGGSGDAAPSTDCVIGASTLDNCTLR